MRSQHLPKIIIAILAVAVAASLGASPLLQKKEKKQEDKKTQDQSQEQPKEDKKPDAAAAGKNDQPAPLFGGKATLKSSRQSKDAQTMGFNGLDPDGKVEKAALAAPIGAIDTMNAQALIAYKPEKQELAKFVAEGKLKTAVPPAPPPAEKTDSKSDKDRDKDKDKDKDKKDKKK